MRRIVLSLLFALGAVPAQAQAPDAAPPPQLDAVTTIVRIDTNHDGAASREEWVAYGFHDAGFTAIDTDHDGRVTVAELRAFRAKNAKTEAEQAALKAENPKFDPALTILMADTNHDGKLSVEELAAWRSAHPPK